MGRPCLIVVPLSTLPNWERELATWAPALNSVVLSGPAAARDAVAKHELYACPKGGSGGGCLQARGGLGGRAAGERLPCPVWQSTAAYF